MCSSDLMTTWVWPAELRPTGQAFYVEALTARFAAALTPQVGVAERPGARWRAELTVLALPHFIGQLDALLAHGGTVLLPDFTRPAGHAPGPSFQAFAAAVGPTAFDDETGFDDGLDFFEGTGTVALLGGCRHWLALGGCWPGQPALTVGDLIQTSPGRAHLITAAEPADGNGIARCTVAPPLRVPPVLGPPVTSNCRVAMTVVGGDAADGQTLPPTRTRYRLVLAEDLSWPIV